MFELSRVYGDGTIPSDITTGQILGPVADSKHNLYSVRCMCVLCLGVSVLGLQLHINNHLKKVKV